MFKKKPPLKPKRTLHERLLAAQKSIDVNLSGDELVAACRKALHKQDVLCWRSGWEVEHPSSGYCVYSYFRLQPGEDEWHKLQLWVDSASDIPNALAQTWEIFLRDLLMIPLLPITLPAAKEVPKNTITVQSKR